MDFLQNLLDNSNIPVITAFLLGLLTAPFSYQYNCDRLYQ